MKYILYFFMLVPMMRSCKSQTPSRNIYNKDFKWTITIPATFDNVDPKAWARLQEKGTKAIEQTSGEKVDNQAKNIFIFKSDQLNYFESNYQPFDTKTDGDYLVSCHAVNNVLYKTMKAQTNGSKIDTSSTIEKVNGLTFQVFKMVINLPNNAKFSMMMFSHLFDKREFSVNIMFMDQEKGDLMLEAWRNSKFDN